MGKRKRTEEDDLVDFIGETISTESAILATSINLMRAGNIAKEKGDSKTLIRVANAWYDLAKFLSGEEDEESNSKPAGFGFTALEIMDDPRDEPDESSGGPEVRKKSW